MPCSFFYPDEHRKSFCRVGMIDVKMIVRLIIGANHYLCVVELKSDYFLISYIVNRLIVLSLNLIY